MGLLLIAIHLGVATLWLGSMSYSLFVVQPRVARLFRDPVQSEDVYRELAAGNRWRVVTLIATLGGSGLALTFVGGSHSTGWWVGVGLKSALWLVATGLFWWVSWRGWPRRIFALPEELPREQALFRRFALGITACVALSFAVGVLLSHS